MTTTALIVGAGSGISASFARQLAKEGYRVALASRDPTKLTRLAAETKATTHTCNAADTASVDQLFADIDRQFPKLDVCLFNASARAQGPITDVDRNQARMALLILAYGGFLVAQAAARRMLPQGAGTILLTGASASVKGYPQSAVCDGQIRPARLGAIDGPGTSPQGHPCRTLRHRRLSAQCREGPRRRSLRGSR